MDTILPRPQKGAFLSLSLAFGRSVTVLSSLEKEAKGSTREKPRNGMYSVGEPVSRGLLDGLDGFSGCSQY